MIYLPIANLQCVSLTSLKSSAHPYYWSWGLIWYQDSGGVPVALCVCCNNFG